MRDPSTIHFLPENRIKEHGAILTCVVGDSVQNVIRRIQDRGFLPNHWQNETF